MVKLAVTLKWLFHIDMFIGSLGRPPDKGVDTISLFSANGTTFASFAVKTRTETQSTQWSSSSFCVVFFVCFFFFFFFLFLFISSPPLLWSFPVIIIMPRSTVRYRTGLVSRTTRSTKESVMPKHRTCSCIGTSMKSKDIGHVVVLEQV